MGHFVLSESAGKAVSGAGAGSQRASPGPNRTEHNLDAHALHAFTAHAGFAPSSAPAAAYGAAEASVHTMLEPAPATKRIKLKAMSQQGSVSGAVAASHPVVAAGEQGQGQALGPLEATSSAHAQAPAHNRELTPAPGAGAGSVFPHTPLPYGMGAADRQEQGTRLAYGATPKPSITKVKLKLPKPAGTPSVPKEEAGPSQQQGQQGGVQAVQSTNTQLPVIPQFDGGADEDEGQISSIAIGNPRANGLGAEVFVGVAASAQVLEQSMAQQPSQSLSPVPMDVEPHVGLPIDVPMHLPLRMPSVCVCVPGTEAVAAMLSTPLSQPPSAHIPHHGHLSLLLPMLRQQGSTPSASPPAQHAVQPFQLLPLTAVAGAGDGGGDDYSKAAVQPSSAKQHLQMNGAFHAGCSTPLQQPLAPALPQSAAGAEAAEPAGMLAAPGPTPMQIDVPQSANSIHETAAEGSATSSDPVHQALTANHINKVQTGGAVHTGAAAVGSLAVARERTPDASREQEELAVELPLALTPVQLNPSGWLNLQAGPGYSLGQLLNGHDAAQGAARGPAGGVHTGGMSSKGAGAQAHASRQVTPVAAKTKTLSLSAIAPSAEKVKDVGKGLVALGGKGFMASLVLDVCQLCQCTPVARNRYTEEEIFGQSP